MKIKNHNDNRNFAFVASTLPIYALDKNIRLWKIKEIFLASEDLFQSYKFLVDRFPEVKIIIIPKDRLFQSFFLFWQFLKIKFSRNKSYFFHECCWVVFDLLVNLLKPRSEFYPQVKMDANPINNDYFVKGSFWKKFFIFFWMRKIFNCHKLISNDSYCFAIKEYPKSTKVNEISSRKSIKNHNIKSKKVLLIIDSSFRQVNVMSIMQKIIKLLLVNGYDCEMKDHPRKIERFEIKDEFSDFQVKEINPQMPIELMDDKYCAAIGLYSTALLFFGDRAISIINLLNEFGSEYEYQKKHFINMPGGNEILYINNVEEILDFLFNIKKF